MNGEELERVCGHFDLDCAIFRGHGPCVCWRERLKVFEAGESSVCDGALMDAQLRFLVHGDEHGFLRLSGRASAEFRCPILIVYGDRDSFTSYDESEVIARGLHRQANLVTVSGAEHGFHRDHETVFVASSI